REWAGWPIALAVPPENLAWMRRRWLLEAPPLWRHETPKNDPRPARGVFGRVPRPKLGALLSPVHRRIAQGVGVLVVLSLLGCGGTLRPSGRLDRARYASSCARVPASVRAARHDVEPRDLALPPDMDPDIRRVAEAARLDPETRASPTRRLQRI